MIHPWGIRRSCHRSIGSILVLLASLVTLAVPLPAEDAPAGDAASQLVQRHGCAKIKEWAQGSAGNAMQAWADYIVTGVRQDSIYGILERGVADDCISNMGNLLTLVQSLEEAASGDLWKAAEIAGGGAWEMQLAILGGPHAAAVWAVCKELNEFANQLNEEMVYINLRTGANWAEQDPALLGPGGVDHFLDAYLKWEDRSPYGLNTRVRQFRTMYYEYIKVALNQTDFPDVNDWPAQRNRVRAAAASMLNDIRLIVKGRERQKSLGEKARLLQADLDAIRDFQAWWTMIKGITCTGDLIDGAGDPMGTCAEAASGAAELLAESEALLDRMTVPPAAQALREEIHRHGQDIDRAAASLDAALETVRELCAAGREEWEGARSLLERVEGRAAALEWLVDEAGSQADRACAATDPSTAGLYAEWAEKAAREAGETASEITAGRSDFSAWAPPEPIDLDTLLALNERDLRRFQGLTADLEAAQTARDGIRSRTDTAEGLLRSCDLRARMALGEEMDLGRRLEELDRRLSAMREALDLSSLPSREDLLTLEAELEADAAFLRELIERQREGRACLDGVPDLQEMVGRMDRMGADAATQATEARSHAGRARACAEGDGDPGDGGDPSAEVVPPIEGDGDDDPDPGAGETGVPPSAGDDWEWETANEPDGPDADGDGDGPAQGWLPVGGIRTIDQEVVAPPADPPPGGGGRSGAAPSASDPAVEASIRAAEAAFGDCDFASAQAHADRVGARDPSHPWLAANYRTIAGNADRQREATAVLQSAQARLQSSDLQAGDIVAIRQSIQNAAQIAPNCMVDRINGVLDRVSAGAATAKSRDRAQAAEAIGGLISTLITAGAMVQASTHGAPPRGTGSVAVPPYTGGGGGGAPPAGGGAGGSTMGDYCSITIVGINPDTEKELTCWALVDFYVQGTPRVDNYMVIPVTKKQTLQQAIAMYAQMGAANRLVGTGSRSQMKSSAKQACPQPSRYSEY